MWVDYGKIKSNDSIIHTKYGSLFQEFHYEKGFSSIIYYPILLLRTVIFAISTIYSTSQSLHIELNAISSFIILLYLIYYKPFKVRLILITNIIIEAMIGLIYILNMIRMFSDILNNDEYFDLAFISIIFSGLVFQYFVSLISFAIKIVSILKTKRNEVENKNNN